jgi:hypothetical protein
VNGDETIAARWPRVIGILGDVGLVAAWEPAEDDTVDDCIDVRTAGAEDELGSLQYGLDRRWTANAWTGPERTAMAHGALRSRAEDAASDLVDLLRRYGRVV